MAGASSVESEVRRRPTQQRSQDRFDALVDAAGRLIGERGVDGVSMTDIAVEADVALTAAYRYFPNKLAVVRELCLRSFEADDAVYDAFADRAGRSLRTWIEDAVSAYCQSELDNSARMQIRAAVHANVELAQLNFADSSKNAGRVADALIAEGLDVERAELASRALLLLKLFDGAIGLARSVTPDESSVVIDRFARLASTLVLGDDDPDPEPRNP